MIPAHADRLRATRRMALRLADAAPGPLSDAARDAAETLADMLPMLADLLEGHAFQIHDELEKTR